MLEERRRRREPASVGDARTPSLELDGGHFPHGCELCVAFGEVLDGDLPRLLRATAQFLIAAAENRKIGRITNQQPGELVVAGFNHQPQLPAHAIHAREVAGGVAIRLRTFPPLLHFPVLVPGPRSLWLRPHGDP